MNKKLIIGIVAVLIIAGAVVAGIILTQRQQDIRTSADPATTLSITPPSGTVVEQGDELVASIEINTNENSVVIADLVITYDATRLQANSVVPGTFFANPQVLTENIDNDIGRIEYGLALPIGATPRQGTGTLAAITFSTIEVGDAEIAFGPDTTIGGFEDDSDNVLIGSTPTTITIIPSEDGGTGDEPTLTPTPTATADGTGGGGEDSPTPTATPTPTVTATGGGTTDGTGGGGSGVGGTSPTATATSTATSQAGATTTPETLPDTAWGTPTIIIGSLGVILVIGSLFIAL